MWSIPSVLGLAAVVASLPAHAVNKCTLADGRIVYSDTPCPTTARQAQTVSEQPVIAPISPRPTRPTANPGAPLPADAPLQLLPPRRTVEFSGLPQSDLSLAAAAMEKIRVLGRDCEWALQVDRGKMQSCVDFLSRMQPKGEFDQINTRIIQVLTYEPGAARTGAAADDLRKLQGRREEALRYKQIAMARLGGR